MSSNATPPLNLNRAFMDERPIYSVIIATAGRPSLDRTLRSIRRQAYHDTEVIVISDGPQPAAEATARRHAASWPALRYVSGPLSRRWGHAQRDEAIRHARGEYLLFMDDDDIYRRDAFRHIRRATQKHPGRVIIFRMRRYDGILWRRPELREGQVSTQVFLVPNLPGRIGSWTTRERYASDFDFISETVALQGPPVWDPTVIATVEPLDRRNLRPWFRLRWDHWRVKLAIRTRLRRLLHIG